MSRRARGRRLRWLLAAAAAVVALELARVGAADFLRLEPCAYLDFLQASGSRADAALLGAARDRLELARRLDGANPVVHEYLALVYVHRAQLVADDVPLYVGYLEQAESHYASAVSLRPNSPYLWAGVALVRGALAAAQPGVSARLQPGLRHAIRRATALAAYEPAVLASIARTAAEVRAVLGEEELAGIAEAERRLRTLRRAAPHAL